MTLQIQKVQHPIAKKAGIELSMARADLIHPLASGNKIYKLMPNLEYAKANGYSEILSFGGAFSNHIHALALMAEKQGFKSTGIIRGESEYANNPTLQDAQKAGMQLQFVSREVYKRRDDADYLAELQTSFPNALIIPEGGSSQLAIMGCAKLAKDIGVTQADEILTVACGTGATLAGLVCGASKHQTIIGYAVLRDESLEARVNAFIKNANVESLDNLDKNQSITSQYKIEKADFGGYAKLDKSLLGFIIDWLQQTGILLDPTYTSKMCMKLMQQIDSGEFKAGTSITMVHSGGLQGWRGMKSRVVALAGGEQWQIIENHL